MGIIRTVTGDICPDNLGICLPHEHLLGMPPQPYQSLDPDLKLDDIDASLREVIGIQRQGINSLVEMTPIDYHRDAIGLQQISIKTGLHIICATGYLKDKFCKSIVSQMSIDEIARQMITEIKTGIGDSGFRAGVIKASSSLDQITDNEKKVFHAAAIAQQSTGALISTHTEAGTMALEQIDLLTRLGVPSNRILIGHLDRKLDHDYHKSIARSGVYMGYDQISKQKYAPDKTRIDFITQMIEDGHLSQLMLSMDLARRSNFQSYGGQPGHNYFMDTFVPMLQSVGFDETTIATLLKDNPKVALTIDE